MNADLHGPELTGDGGLGGAVTGQACKRERALQMCGPVKGELDEFKNELVSMIKTSYK